MDRKIRQIQRTEKQTNINQVKITTSKNKNTYLVHRPLEFQNLTNIDLK